MLPEPLVGRGHLCILTLSELVFDRSSDTMARLRAQGDLTHALQHQMFLLPLGSCRDGWEKSSNLSKGPMLSLRPPSDSLVLSSGQGGS